MNTNPLDIFGVFADDQDNVSTKMGRPHKLLSILKEDGRMVRDHQCEKMHLISLQRPCSNYFINRLNRIVAIESDDEDDLISLQENI